MGIHGNMVGADSDGNGDIFPSRFIVQSPDDDNSVREAGADASNVVGVSGEGTVDWPDPSFAGPLPAARSGERDHFEMIPPGGDGLIEIAAAVVRGTYGKPDADGKAVTAGSGDLAFCMFRQSGGADGEKVQVDILQGVTVP